jgi:hypothetical protein
MNGLELAHMGLGEVPHYLGVKMWIDPSDSNYYTLNSGNYQQIRNKGIWGGSVDQSTSTKRPSQAANYFGTGLHAVYPDDVDDIMDVTGTWDLWGNSLKWTIYFIHYQINDGHGGFLQMSNGDYLLHNTERFRIWDGTASSGIELCPSSSYVTTTKYITEVFTHDSGAGSGIYIWLNGTDKTHTTTPTISNDVGSITDLYSSNSWPAGWRFGEFVAWDRVLSSAERTMVRTYLNDKWSIY